MGGTGRRGTTSGNRRIVKPEGQVVARGGVEPPTFRFSVGRSYQLSYLAGCTPPHSPECEARAHSTGARAAGRNQDDHARRSGSTVSGMAEDVEIRHRISELVDLERSLREQL